MGNLRFVVAILFVAACGSDHANTPDAHVIPDSPSIDAKVFMDAPPPVYDFSCMTNAAPAAGSATANITLSGTAQEIKSSGATPTVMPLAGATLKPCLTGAANCNAGNMLAPSVTSAADGSYAFAPIATSTNPLDVYIALTKTGDRDTYVYAPQPFVMDQGMIPVLAFDSATFAGLIAIAQITQSAANGTLGIAVTDCANMPIDGATVTVKQNGTAVANTTDLDAGTLNAMAAGVHFIFNVPPGDTEVGATYMGMTLRAHVVKVFAASTTETIVRPGYF